MAAHRPDVVFASSGPVGLVVSAEFDPHSDQPALKSTSACIAPAAERLHGLLVRQSGGALPGFCRWVRVPIENGQLYRLSFAGDLPDSAMVRALMPEGEERLEVVDAGRGTLRAAAITGQLVAALFVAPEAARLPRAEMIAALLGTPVAEAARAALLAGRADQGAAEEGPRICACFGIGRAAIRHAIVTHGLGSVAELGRYLRAGTNCGSCIPELEEILRHVHAPAA